MKFAKRAWKLAISQPFGNPANLTLSNPLIDVVKLRDLTRLPFDYDRRSSLHAEKLNWFGSWAKVKERFPDINTAPLATDTSINFLQLISFEINFTTFLLT